MSITMNDLRRAVDVESLEQCGLRLPPTWLVFLRARFPNQSDTQMLRRLIATSVFELSCGGEEALRKQTFASIYQLTQKANDLLHDETDYPEAA